MDLLHLVDRLEELVASAQKMPIGSRAMIDRRRLLDVVDQMRVVIPQEVREAQELVARRAEIEREAGEEARLTVARAEEQAARLVEEHEIAAAAHIRAGELAAEADARLEQRIAEANADIQSRLAESRRLAEQQMAEADEYAGDLLRRLQRQLRAFVSSVDAGLGQIEGVPEGEPATARAEATDGAARDAHDHDDRDGDDRERPATVTATVPATIGIAAASGPMMMPMPMPAAAVLRGDDEHLADDSPVDDDPADDSPAGNAPASDNPADEAPLENLLARPPSPLRPSALTTSGDEGATSEGVIDDFALPGLDDEPARDDRDAEDA